MQDPIVQKLLDELHVLTIKSLLTKIKCGDMSASEYNSVITILKHNDHQLDPATNPAIAALAEELENYNPAEEYTH